MKINTLVQIITIFLIVSCLSTSYTYIYMCYDIEKKIKFLENKVEDLEKLYYQKELESFPYEHSKIN